MKRATAKKKTKPESKSRDSVKRGRSASTRTKRAGGAATNDRWMAVAWMIPAVLLVFFIGSILRTSPRYPLPVTSARLMGLFQRTQTRPLPERVAFWSENLMKDPNLLAPLGSGPEINDTAPLFPRGYDCTTYVETVGALALSRGDDLAERLVNIRYRDGKVSYENRNHFPEADWIPNNESAGLLADVTVRVARKSGFVAAFANKDIDKLAWFKARRNEDANRVVANAPSDASVVTVRLPYLPIEHALDALQHIPQGAVVNVVRENREKFPVLVSHQGFLVWKDGVAYFRHASRYKHITETPFADYVREARAMPWKVIGFNINTFI